MRLLDASKKFSIHLPELSEYLVNQFNNLK